MKSIFTSFKMLCVMSVLTGVIYPLIIYMYANIFIHDKASGSFIQINNQIIGSELIGQKFTKDNYFWSRPSVIDYQSNSSGGSNLGPTSSELKKQVLERKIFLEKTNSGNPPQDLLFASASGLDPHLSVEGINYQIPRISKSRSITSATLQQLVQEVTEKPQYGLFGETRINVLKLNKELDMRYP